MKKRHKVTLTIAVGLFCTVVGLFAFGLISFQLGPARRFRNAPAPELLTLDEISRLESVYSVSFPPSTTQIRAYYNGDMGLYCRVDFDQADLEVFRSNRSWISGAQAERIITRVSFAPLRRVLGTFAGTAKPIPWWELSGEDAAFASTGRVPNDPGGHADVVVARLAGGKMSAYMALGAHRHAIPREVLDIFPLNKPRWDVRESKVRPMPSGEDGR
ncbi:MAG: hypothetical protein ACYTEX_26815 [Planctomycetota bacterium]|jgi:hypothetical protein